MQNVQNTNSDNFDITIIFKIGLDIDKLFDFFFFCNVNEFRLFLNNFPDFRIYYMIC